MADRIISMRQKLLDSLKVTDMNLRASAQLLICTSS